MMQQLKERTRVHHERTEAAPMLRALMTPEVTREHYAATVARLYGFYAPLERSLSAHREVGFVALAGLDLAMRTKTPSLERDLAALGLEREVLPLCDDLPRLPTAAHVFGCAYVLEGATLGGQIIGRHLRERLGIGAESGAAFYAAYGKQIGPMWRRFGRSVDAYARAHPDRSEAIVEGAARTFDALGRWLAAPGHAEQLPTPAATEARA
jgi:heme oxygenase